VNLLRAHGIEVSRARAAFKVKEGEYPAGTYVVRADQPYRGYALDLLLPQKFPADKTPYEPYDDVAWALPFGYGVDATPIEDPSVKTVALDRVTQPVGYQGMIAGRGPAYLLRDTGQESLLAARVRLARFQIEAAEAPFKSGAIEYPAGSWILPDQPELRPALEAVARDLDLQVVAGVVPQVARHALDLPRLGLVQTWSDTQSPGWVRMVFDDEGIPYTLVMDEDLRRGGLRQRFDVLLMPNTDDSLKEIVGGIDPRHAPLAYTKSPEFPTQGLPTSSPDITGGPGWAGVGNLETFVREGGLLVTLGGASTLPLDGGIARGIRRARTSGLYTPGSELRVRFRQPRHPLAYGYPEVTSVFREDRTLYAVRRSDEGKVVLQYGEDLPDDEEDEGKADEKPKAKDDDKKPFVVSGGIKGEKDILGKPAILDLPTGKGRILAFDFDPIHRYLTLSDFRLAWNAILNWNDLPAAP
jgi:hypothetical protein